MACPTNCLLALILFLSCRQVETAAGIKEGGRTGLTAITIGVLFLCSVFLAPLFGKVTGHRDEGQ